MMQRAKIHLSEEELELMQNSSWILTKNSIMDKIAAGLAELGNRLSVEVLQFSVQLPAGIFDASHKVSRGEKYKGLPYLVLDYPRVFGKDDILAIRMLCWWGNYYSVTLHSRGEYCRLVKEKLRSGLVAQAEEQLYISFHGDEWNHDIQSADYQPYSIQFPKQEEIEHASFIKLSLKIPLSQWEDAEEKLYNGFYRLLYLLKS